MEDRSFISKIMHNIPVAIEVANEKGIVYLIKYEVTTDVDMVLFHLNHVYSKLLAFIFKRTLIHVIGNSHTMAFKKNRFFIVYNIGPATAYNLVNRNSTVKSNEKLFAIINKINKKRDVVILVFGEIDCRVHFYNQFKKSGGRATINDLMDRTIENYGKVLQQLNEMNVNFIVYGVLPASKQIYRFPQYATAKMRKELFDDFSKRYPYLAPPQVRSKLNMDFNDKLKKYCNLNGYRFIDIYKIVVDNNGFIKDEFAADEIHVNGKIMSHIKKNLKDDYGIIK